MVEAGKVSLWRIVLAGFLDFFTILLTSGFIIGALTGGLKLTVAGLELNGWPALLWILVIGLYFWAFPKYFGGRIWQRILKAVR